MTGTAALFALAGCASWALALVLSKIGLRETSLSLFCTVEFAILLLLAIVYGLVREQIAFVGWRPTLVALGGGFLDSVIGVFLYLSAIRRMEVHRVAPLSNVAPFWGLVAAVLFLGERPTLMLFLAAVIIVTGAYFLTAQPRAADTVRWDWRGSGLAVASGIVWGVAETVPTKYCLMQGMNPLTYQLALGVICAFTWSGIALSHANKETLCYSGLGIGIGAICGVASFMGWLLWLKALELVEASQLVPFRGTLVLFAFGFTVVFLKEKFTRRSVLGTAFIVLALVLAFSG